MGFPQSWLVAHGVPRSRCRATAQDPLTSSLRTLRPSRGLKRTACSAAALEPPSPGRSTSRRLNDSEAMRALNRDEADPGPESRPSGWSIGRNSWIRLASDAAAAIFLAVAGVVVARVLGADGKGLYASLSFLAIVLSHLAASGLGDGLAVLVGRGAVDRPTALSVSAVYTVATSAAGALVLGAVAHFLVDPELPGRAFVILFFAAAVPGWSWYWVVGGVLNAWGHVRYTSLLYALSAATTGAGIVVAVLLLDLGMAGAAAAFAGGPLLAAVFLGLIALTQAGPLKRPDISQTKRALRLGLPMQFATLVSVLVARLDVLIVYGLLGPSDAGIYSVGMTGAELVTYGPYALAVAAFPAVAHASSPEIRSVIGRTARMSAVSGLIVAVALAPVLPFVIPLVFGAEFVGSVSVALLLLAAMVLSGQQWVLCRCLGARGQTGPLFQSYLFTLLAMVGLDLLLIPPLGLTGAALGSIAAHLGGLLVVARAALRHVGDVSALVPGWADVEDLLVTLRGWVRRPGEDLKRSAE